MKNKNLVKIEILFFFCLYQLLIKENVRFNNNIILYIVKHFGLVYCETNHVGHVIVSVCDHSNKMFFGQTTINSTGQTV